MRKIEKDLNNIPTILNNSNREEAFNKNVLASKYIDKKNLYKVGSVQNKLNEIYSFKCAYCEKDISDDDKHIEHYRPKSKYYWLAYSWDNLLLCCSKCNKNKSDKFPVLNTPILYTNEQFSDIHCLGEDYDKREEPKIINPEREDVLNELQFDRDGRIFSKNSRIIYTIDEICKLNRNELVEKRIKLLNGFIRRIEKHYKIYLDKKDYHDYSMFEPDIEELIESCSIENQFYTFRYFIINNIEIFFEEHRVLQMILKHLIVRRLNGGYCLLGVGDGLL